MRPPWLVIGLIASVAINLFLIGAAAGVIALGLRMARESPQRPGALLIATAQLPQPDRRNFRQMLVGVRGEIAADTAQSRDLRLAAWGALADPNPDVAAIKARLARSRQIDVGARAKVEEKIADYVAALPPAERTIFAAGMRRVLTAPAGAAAPPPQPPAAKGK
jgi:uncharacterized membrane protein